MVILIGYSTLALRVYRIFLRNAYRGARPMNLPREKSHARVDAYLHHRARHRLHYAEDITLGINTVSNPPLLRNLPLRNEDFFPSFLNLLQCVVNVIHTYSVPHAVWPHTEHDCAVDSARDARAVRTFEEEEVRVKTIANAVLSFIGGAFLVAIGWIVESVAGSSSLMYFGGIVLVIVGAVVVLIGVYTLIDSL